VYFGGVLRKKATFLFSGACIIILVVVFLAFDVPNGQAYFPSAGFRINKFLAFHVLYGLHQDTIPVEEIIRDPSSWVNKTVTVEGILESVPMPNPTLYGLRPENQTSFLSVQWNSSNVLIPYNGTTAIVHGTIKEEEWTIPNLIPQNHTMEVYYIEAENVELH